MAGLVACNGRELEGAELSIKDFESNDSDGSAPADKCFVKRPRETVRWILDNHLLLGLGMRFCLGLGVPSLGVWAATPQVNLGLAGRTGAVKLINIAMQFLVSGLRMKTDEMLGAVRSPFPLCVSLVLILFVTPCVGFLALRLPIQPVDFTYGLAVFCCVPTTLTRGAAMIASSIGTERGAQLAFLIVVSSSIVGCVTAPLMLKWQLATGAAPVTIDQRTLLLNLMLLVLVPLLVGKFLREAFPRVSRFSAQRKVALGLFANANMLCLVWQAVSGSQHVLFAQSPVSIAICVASGLGLHMVFWVINSVVFVVPCISDIHHRRAVFLLVSQKTLPLSLAIAAGLPQEKVNAGVVVLPCILSFMCQLTVDSFLVKFWAKSASGDSEGVAECVVAERPPPIITVAITGHRTTREMAPTLPVLLREQVEAAVEAVACGASVVHLHVCEENESEVISTVAAERYHEVIRAIRERVPGVILEITCRGVDGQVGMPENVERGNLVMVEPAMWGNDPALRLEIVALNMSTRNIDDCTVILNPIQDVEKQIRRIYELGCTPRCDVYNAGDILVSKRLLAKGVLRAPVNYLLILGSFSGIGAGRNDLEFMVSQLPAGAIWTALGTGKHNFPVAQNCVDLGGHLRTGFEDCTYVSKGVTARSNAELVSKLAGICRSNGTRPATLAEARHHMGFAA